MKLGTRGSRLARWQAEWVRDRLAAQGVRAEIVVIKTRGDAEVDENTRGVSPHATRRSNTICTAFWLVNTTQRYAERPVSAARNAPRSASG